MTKTSFENLTAPFIPSASLSLFTTFQLGGSCKGMFQCRTPEELEATIRFLHKSGEPFLLIGGGSNLLVSDEGVDCYVLRYVSDQPIIEYKGAEVSVSASTSLDSLALWAAQKGFGGINCCTGIPGTVGGAVVGNAGAFGEQIGDVVKSVALLNAQGATREVWAKDLGFSYRHSRLKETDDIVSRVVIALKEGDREALLREREEVLAMRSQKHPHLKEHPCAGSFFRNIEPTSRAEKRQAAGWFLEQAGGKTLVHGGARIYDKHANIIVKGKRCTAQDVYELQKRMAEIVKDKFQLDLVREVRLVGKFAGKPDGAGLVW